jgi:hypothetical protein
MLDQRRRLLRAALGFVSRQRSRALPRHDRRPRLDGARCRRRAKHGARRSGNGVPQEPSCHNRCASGSSAPRRRRRDGEQGHAHADIRGQRPPDGHDDTRNEAPTARRDRKGRSAETCQLPRAQSRPSSRGRFSNVSANRVHVAVRFALTSAKQAVAVVIRIAASSPSPVCANALRVSA